VVGAPVLSDESGRSERWHGPRNPVLPLPVSMTMTLERPPLRVMRMILITLLLLAAIVLLVPEEHTEIGVDRPVESLAVSDTLKAAP
jgi:hypothetical protein